MATRARRGWPQSAFQSTLNSFYRIILQQVRVRERQTHLQTQGGKAQGQNFSHPDLHAVNVRAINFCTSRARNNFQGQSHRAMRAGAHNPNFCNNPYFHE